MQGDSPSLQNHWDGEGGRKPGRKMKHCDRDTFMAFSAQLCGTQHWWKPRRSPLMSIHVPDGPRLTDVKETKMRILFMARLS